jgi:hypothetical protein
MKKSNKSQIENGVKNVVEQSIFTLTHDVYSKAEVERIIRNIAEGISIELDTVEIEEFAEVEELIDEVVEHFKGELSTIINEFDFESETSLELDSRNQIEIEVDTQQLERVIEATFNEFDIHDLKSFRNKVN